ncbi:MAG: class D beta-lactamase, partial [Gammaproteobacteria bacterium]|nr:class D beta-lactamase [Gammaproteobacteria bacterium]
LIQGRDRHQSLNLEFNPQQCRLALSPCSTFKIANALIGLQTGAVSGPGHVREWDGVQHGRQDLNRDHDLASAMRHSAVWYFQDLARDVGEEPMRRWLAELDYGNQDISAGIDRFWLGSSLKIDARRQMELLKELRHGTLPFRPEHQQAVRDMLAQDSGLAGALYGKTGSCAGGEGTPRHGWFIGWLDGGSERNPSTTWFVINIRGEEARGSEARRIALELLADLHD